MLAFITRIFLWLNYLIYGPPWLRFQSTECYRTSSLLTLLIRVQIIQKETMQRSFLFVNGIKSTTVTVTWIEGTQCKPKIVTKQKLKAKQYMFLSQSYLPLISSSQCSPSKRVLITALINLTIILETVSIQQSEPALIFPHLISKGKVHGDQSY